MRIFNGQQYTFSFIPSGVDLSGPFSSVADATLRQLQDDGFPLAEASARSEGGLGGYLSQNSIDITFKYIGTDTDDASFGNAMADDLNNSFSTSSFSYNGATASDAMNSSLIDKAKAVFGVTSGGSASSATPSLGILGIGIIAIGLLAVAVYSFAGAAGARAV